MTGDPYKVLGLEPDATDEQVKAAYRKLAKLNHPDVNNGDPRAEQRMKEINEAYDIIIHKKQRGYEGAGGYGAYTGGYTASDSGASGEMRAAVNYINSGNFYEALSVLSGIYNRDARWYYLSAIANMGIGNRINALNHAQQACSMEPNNPEYAALLSRFEGFTAPYQEYGRRYATPDLGGIGKICMMLCCMRSICPCCWC